MWRIVWKTNDIFYVLFYLDLNCNPLIKKGPENRTNQFLHNQLFAKVNQGSKYFCNVLCTQITTNCYVINSHPTSYLWFETYCVRLIKLTTTTVARYNLTHIIRFNKLDLTDLFVLNGVLLHGILSFLSLWHDKWPYRISQRMDSYHIIKQILIQIDMI